ncbi:MAG TPA: monovalent cation/H+ antiporter complex subunit F [Dehalococcoidia bacterium]|nr:monovalent cation/H+ antiporter complex subunit F [Dehalococcoidia bacterium]
MQIFFVAVLLTTVALALVYLFRMVFGPTLFDRLLGLNGISNKAILILVLIGTLYERLDVFVDISVGYALLNLVGAVAVAKYLEMKGMP